ncbi:MAG: peptidoglycan DD-metalloendopeptidase family protein [Syntrophales bacterium]
MGQFMTECPRFRSFPSLPACWKLIVVLLVGVMLLSCSSLSFRSQRNRGVYHRVKSGETLFAIARAYQVSVQELAEVNNIARPDDIAVDSVIFIPAAGQVLDDVLAESRLQAGETPAAEAKAAAPPPAAPKEPSQGATAAEGKARAERAAAEAAKDRAALSRAAQRDLASRKAAEKAPTAEAADRTVKKRDEEGGGPEIKFDRKRFIWPVKGRVVAKFGTESVTTDFNGRKVETARIMHNGIKIAAAAGAPVIAAEAGKVIYSMTLERFGNTIIIEHDDEFKTVYYELGRRSVETLQKVKKGEPIGSVGDGGAAKAEPAMQFEVRHRNKPRNPLFFLP